MAAFSCFGKCESCSSFIFFIFLIFVSCMFVIDVTVGQTTTTGAATSTIPVETSTESTVTTTIPITTPAPTTPPPTQIPQNTDIGPCPCDLTGFACDVNCCCDDDCSAEDKKAFRFCFPFSFTEDDKVCMKSQLILIENSPYQTNFTSNDLFCIYFNNYLEKNFYVNPDLVTNQDMFNKYLKKYAGFSFQPGTTPTPAFSEFYKSGDPILVVYESRTTGTLGQPKAMSSPHCNDVNPAAYLIEKSNECVRRITNLQTECTSLRQLDASSYYLKFRVVRTPALFGTYVPAYNLTVNDTHIFRVPAFGTSGPDSIPLVDVTDLYNNTYTVDVQLDDTLCDVGNGLTAACILQSPSYNFATHQCENVVKKVRYRILYNGTMGISSVWAQFTLHNVASSVTLVPQIFSTQFEHITEGNVFRRSGNPGYVIGEPVMAGNLETYLDADGKELSRIVLNQNRDQWMTVVRSSVNGDCITDKNQGRISITFGQDIRSGCFIQFQQTDMTKFCEVMQEAINNALEGDNMANPLYVAIFGNSDVMKVGDWVPVLVPKRPSPSPPTGYVCRLSLGMHVQILYAKIGSLANPQPKVLGVSYIYDDKQDVYFECIGPLCQPGTQQFTQRVEISMSVSFVDVSEPAVGYQGEAPLFISKAPYDFFYPFLTGSAQRLDASSSIVMFNLVLCLGYGIWTAF